MGFVGNDGEGDRDEQDAHAEGEAPERRSPAEQMKLPQEIVPVVHCPVAAEEGQGLFLRVRHVDGDIRDALACPEERDGEGGDVPLVKEGEGAHRGQNHLEGRASEDIEEARQDEGEGVARLVNDEVDAVNEAQGAARRVEVELALEDLPAEHRHHEQAHGPPGHGGPGYKRMLSLRPWRRLVRRSSQDGRLRRRRTRPPRLRDGWRDRGWSDARRRRGTWGRASA